VLSPTTWLPFRPASRLDLLSEERAEAANALDAFSQGRLFRQPPFSQVILLHQTAGREAVLAHGIPFPSGRHVYFRLRNLDVRAVALLTRLSRTPCRTIAWRSALRDLRASRERRNGSRFQLRTALSSSRSILLTVLRMLSSVRSRYFSGISVSAGLYQRFIQCVEMMSALTRLRSASRTG